MAAENNLTILDGPVGTELNARGVPTPLPLWSASAIETAPDVIAEIHRDYVAAGATVHTANTFRTRRRTAGRRWKELTSAAVDIARRSVPHGQRVAGSLAPLEDCYRPDLSPPNCKDEHREMADWLAECGCDLILCETFPHGGEALEAARAAMATGKPTWLALTAGPDADLMSPESMTDVARRAIDAGVSAVLVNCTPATKIDAWVRALSDASPGVPIGVYANAGSVDDRIGWKPPRDAEVDRYTDLARTWIESGAKLVGGCCGTGPAHVKALATLN